MTESSRNWKEKQMQKRTSSNLISSVLDRIRKWSKIKRNERNKNHKNLTERWLIEMITGSVKKSSLPVTEMLKSIQINLLRMSQIDREELSKMLDQFKKGKKSNFGLR